MLTRLRKAMEEKDQGFTLIELLVVIIIIGILAAIAIPIFLNQRNKGYDSAMESDLRNAATAQETILTEANAYSPTVASLVAAGFKFSEANNYFNGSTGQFSIISATTTRYCMSARSASGTTFYYSSGGLLGTTACT